MRVHLDGMHPLGDDLRGLRDGVIGRRHRRDGDGRGQRQQTEAPGQGQATTAAGLCGGKQTGGFRDAQFEDLPG